MTNEITNTVNNTAADIAAQVANGSAELVEVKAGGSWVKRGVTALVGLSLGAGGFFAGRAIGKRSAAKQFDERLSKIEEYLECGEDFMEEDDEDEESDDAKEEPKAEGKKKEK